MVYRYSLGFELLKRKYPAMQCNAMQCFGIFQVFEPATNVWHMLRPWFLKQCIHDWEISKDCLVRAWQQIYIVDFKRLVDLSLVRNMYLGVVKNLIVLSLEERRQYIFGRAPASTLNIWCPKVAPLLNHFMFISVKYWFFLKFGSLRMRKFGLGKLRVENVWAQWVKRLKLEIWPNQL